MSNVIQFSINGDTNAEKVTDRVKQSVSSLEKNMQGIENKFKSFGKDLFLSFAAPMVILNQAINMISGAIEKSRQEVRDALADAEKGENKYMSAGVTASAREIARARQDALDRKNAELAAAAQVEEQMKLRPGTMGFGGEADAAIAQYEAEGAKMGKMEAFKRDIKGALFYLGLSDMTKDKEMQDVFARRAIEREKTDPTLSAAAKQKKAAEIDAKPTTFKGPEGFSNVVGVGANPVMEAMNAQLEEIKKTNEILQKIAGDSGATSWMNATPSRTSLLMAK